MLEIMEYSLRISGSLYLWVRGIAILYWYNYVGQAAIINEMLASQLIRLFNSDANQSARMRADRSEKTSCNFIITGFNLPQ